MEIKLFTNYVLFSYKSSLIGNSYLSTPKKERLEHMIQERAINIGSSMFGDERLIGIISDVYNEKVFWVKTVQPDRH